MVQTTPEQPEQPEQPYSWLPVARVRRWLQLDAEPEGSPLLDIAEDCRRAAGDYCQQQRRDLFGAGRPVDTAPDGVVQAGVLAAARLYARRSSPAGLASYGEFGAAEVLRLDPDVARLLGTGRHAAPVVG